MSERLLHFNGLPTYPETCVDIRNLEHMLKSCPHRGNVQYVLEGLTNGFDVGFTGGELKDAVCNNKSARENEVLVTQAIKKCLDQKTLSGPFASKPIKTLCYAI